MDEAREDNFLAKLSALQPELFYEPGELSDQITLRMLLDDLAAENNKPAPEGAAGFDFDL